MSATSTPAPIHVREGEELLNRLGIVLCDHRIFSSKHPRFLESCQAFLDGLSGFFASHPEQEHFLFVQREGRVFFRKVPLAALTPPAIKLARLLEERQVEGLRFSPECNLTALAIVVEELARKTPVSGRPPWQDINERLQAEGLKHMVSFFFDCELGPSDDAEVVTTSRPVPEGAVLSLLKLPELALPLDLYRSTLAALHDLMCLLSVGQRPALEYVLEVLERMTLGVLEDEQSFLPLVAVRYRNDFTFNHSVNVCLLSMATLKPYASSADQLVQIGQAALFHDVGKSLCPSELFYRPDVPGKDESHEIELHPVLGAELLQDSAGVGPLAPITAFHHHRRADGGYPRLRNPRPIDTATAVVAAADLFEAMTAERPYKASLAPAEAFRLILKLPEAKGLERAIRLLFDALSPFPPGTLVELDNGERAVVTRVRPGAPHQPCIRRAVPETDGILLEDAETDLARLAESGGPVPRIERALPAVWTWEAGRTDTSPEEDDAREELYRRIETGTLLATEG